MMKDMGIEGIVEKEILELKARGPEDLRHLEPYSAKKIRITERKKAILAVWKDDLDSATTRVIVQCYRPLLLGIGKMEARGFIVDASGKVEDLKRDELYEFT